MPELAEVEYFRRQWAPAQGQRVVRVALHPKARNFKGVNPEQLKAELTNVRLLKSEAQAKQMLFQFESGYLGIHLGMAGRLQVADAAMVPDKHEHLVLYTEQQALVYSDYRMFGKVEWASGDTLPHWWTKLPPPILSRAFTLNLVEAFLLRRKNSPIKAVLLMQERFPGIGNWMADEVLFQSRIRPDRPAGSLTPEETKRLHKTLRHVSKEALRIIAPNWGDLPDTWLFNHRWKDGGTCPATARPLHREKIGGRTTCWSPAWQV